MKITFLGTGHGTAEKNRFCSSAVVTVKGKSYLVDAGAPVSLLMQKKGIHPGTVKAVFITHNHADHYYGLCEFAISMSGFHNRLVPDAHAEVFVPADPDFYHRFMLGHDHTNQINVNVYEEGLVYKDELVRVTSFRTEHCNPSYGFLFEAEGKRVVFTGDMSGSLKDYPTVLTETDVDVAVVEAAHARYAKPEIQEILKKTRTRHMLINHVYEGSNPPEAIADFVVQMQDYFDVTLTQDDDVFLV
ncbi:MAG: MBL fold metallo-hydrolase [Clostridia bacterium]|nr:MBL fold metallo-hydrolase [Clostridia bacterium]MBR2987978.1 MBL fold metallo-hydrolase [Clostridia bacterium]